MTDKPTDVSFPPTQITWADKHNLPPVAAATDPVGGEMVFITKNELGYYAAADVGIVSETTPQQWNAAHGITEGQAMAMLYGAMFGWNCQFAKVRNWTFDGQIKPGILDDSAKKGDTINP